MDIGYLSGEERLRAARCFLFRGTGETAVRRVLSDERCQIVEYKKGSIIYDIKSYRRDLGFILSGYVEVQKPAPDGGSFIMTELRPESVFGAAALFGGGERYVTRLIASKDCRVVFFPKELLLDAMRDDFNLAENYMEFLSGRIRFLNDKINGILFTDTESVLARWLLDNAEEENGAFRVDLKTSYSRLAEILNMGRASLYRSLCELERRGIIKRDGKRITIPEPGRLIIGGNMK